MYVYIYNIYKYTYIYIYIIQHSATATAKGPCVRLRCQEEGPRDTNHTSYDRRTLLPMSVLSECTRPAQEGTGPGVAARPARRVSRIACTCQMSHQLVPRLYDDRYTFERHLPTPGQRGHILLSTKIQTQNSRMVVSPGQMCGRGERPAPVWAPLCNCSPLRYQHPSQRHSNIDSAIHSAHHSTHRSDIDSAIHSGLYSAVHSTLTAALQRPL